MSEIAEREFWATIPVMLNNYHTINRNIFACLLERIEEIEGDFSDCLLHSSDVGVENEHLLMKSCKISQLQDYLNNYTKPQRENCKGFLLLLLKLLSKKNKDSIRTFGIIGYY